MNSQQIFRQYAKDHKRLLAIVGGILCLLILFILKLIVCAIGDGFYCSLLYTKACLRSWLFFLPDSFMNIVSAGDYAGKFLDIIKTGAPRCYPRILVFIALSIVIALASVIGAYYGACKYFFSKSLQNIKKFGEVFDKETYQQRNAKLFGNHLDLSTLAVSQEALRYPVFVWADMQQTLACITGIIAAAKTQNIPLLILEDGDTLYKVLSHKNDILLNPFIQSGYGWDFVKDFQNNDNVIKYMQQSLMIDCEEYLQAFKEYEGITNTSAFLQTLCFGSGEGTDALLKKIVPQSIKNVPSIRKALSEEFEFLSHVSKQNNNISISRNAKGVIWVSGFNKSQMPKLSRFILNTCVENAICIVLQKNSHDIKKHNTIVFNSSFKEFHIRFDGSFLALGNTSDNQDVAELFGQTSIVGLKFADKAYYNINYPAVTKDNLLENQRFFKYYGSYDILRF